MIVLGTDAHKRAHSHGWAGMAFGPTARFGCGVGGAVRLTFRAAAVASLWTVPAISATTAMGSRAGTRVSMVCVWERLRGRCCELHRFLLTGLHGNIAQ